MEHVGVKLLKPVAMPSIYTQVSKSIGYESEPIDLPTLLEAEELYKEVVTGLSEQAFTKVFKLHRFGKSPENYEQQEIQNVITAAFTEGSKYFRQNG